MNLVPIFLSIAAGIAMYAGIIHLVIGLSRRPRDMTNVTFGLASLAIAANALAVLVIHTAGSVEAYVTVFKFGFGPIALLLLGAFMGFVAFYTGVKPRWFLLVMSIWLVVIIALEMALPYGILFADVSGLRQVTLPWGEQIVIAQATPHPWRPLVDLFLFVMFGFFFYAAYRQYRSGDRKRATLLALALVLFFAANIFDTLVDIGIINFIYIQEFAYLAFVIVMSISLSLDVTRTEKELHEYQTRLEVLVEERTAELSAANARLVEREREAATLEERSRIARDLHDAVTQTIYSAALVAEVLPAVWERNPDEGKRNLVKLRQLVRGALAEMRTLLFELRPAALESAGFDTLLQQQADVLTGRTRIPVEITATGAPDLPHDVKVALYRITQEAFNNIAKHSGATQVFVTVQEEGDTTEVRIQDNGRGFSPALMAGAGMGLRIMRERAEDIGARLQVESASGQGTQLSIIWPTPEERS